MCSNAARLAGPGQSDLAARSPASNFAVTPRCFAEICLTVARGRKAGTASDADVLHRHLATARTGDTDGERVGAEAAAAGLFEKVVGAPRRALPGRPAVGADLERLDLLVAVQHLH